jgi:hypothetical protein
MALKQASKEQAKLRLAIYGLSGGGKTYSSLAIATGIGGKIAVLDTEYRTASKYANSFIFDTDDFGEPSIENYIRYIDMVKDAGIYNVLVIDSISHAWQYVLQKVDQLKETTCHGDGRKAWAIMTPEYKRLVTAVITAPFHIIVTMRAKTEWSTTNENGNKTVRRDTLAPEQRDGFEYEFDMLMEMNATHYGTIIKDRTNKFQDEIVHKPGIEFGRRLGDWLKDGAVSIEKQTQDAMREIGNILKSENQLGERYFSEEEYAKVKAALKESVKQDPQERLIFVNNVLDEQKELLIQRVSEDSELAVAPASPPPSHEKPAVHQTVSKPASPEPAPESKPAKSSAAPPPVAPAQVSLPPVEPPKTETAAAPEKPAIPAMYAEEEPPAEEASGTDEVDDGFEDDIPFDPPAEVAVATMTLGKSGGSLSKAFQNHIGNMKREKAVATADELDIF